MFSLSLFEKIPTTRGIVSGTWGGNYVYDPAYNFGTKIGEVYVTYQMPIPVSEPKEVQCPPTLMQGVIDSKPYVGPNSDLILSEDYGGTSPTIERYVPVYGHTEDGADPFGTDQYLRELAALDTSDRSNERFVPGMKKFYYTQRVEKTFTKSGVSVWYYRGKRYTRPWTRTTTKVYYNKRYYWAYTDVAYKKVKRKRRLHHCQHTKVDGELWLTATSLGFHPTLALKTHFESSWPATCNPGVWHAGSGPRRQLVEYPTGLKVGGKQYRVFPRLYGVFHCETDSSSTPIVDNVYQHMMGVRYVARIALNLKSYGKGTGNVFAFVTWPKTQKRGLVRFYSWVNDPKQYYPWIFAATNTLSVDLPLVNDVGVYDSFLKNVWQRSQSLLKWSVVNIYRSLPVDGLDPTKISVTDRVRLLYDRLWRSVLPADMERIYSQVVGYASQNALLNVKVLNINSLMYLKDFAEVGSLCSSYADLLLRGISPKTVSGAYLASHYGVRLTIRDTKEIIQRAKREFAFSQSAYQYSYGGAKRQLAGPCGDIDVKGNVSVLFTLYDEQIRRFLAGLIRWDLVPDPRVIWDMIPYSFVVDWIYPLGTHFESISAMLASATVDQKRCCWSQKTVATLDPTLLVSALSKEDTSVVASSGCMQLIGYKRQYQHFAPSPSANLGLFELDPTWSKSRLYEIASLTAQRFT